MVTGRLFFCALAACLAWAQPAAAVDIDPQRAAALAADPTWLRLLHADKDRSTRSAVNSPEFFLTGNANALAGAELNEALKLPAVPVPLSQEADPRCRFPARYFWLSHQLNLPAWRDLSHCTRLLDWAGFDTLDSITLIMISGYFGNPASTFGHSLMRLNNSEFNADSPLLDLGINFGARVPPEEPTIVYIARGLFGGYQAGFSDRSFFEHDRTYSRIEHRDRWEYDLRLDDYQQRLLTLHLWELTTREFTYYFLEENCSYRLAELLELVTGDTVLDDVGTWYAPVSLFHDLRELQARDGGALFEPPRYVPSIDRELRVKMASLAPGERQAFDSLIDPDAAPAVSISSALPSDRRRSVIATALDFFEYELSGVEDGELPALRQRKREVLLARLALPTGGDAAPSPAPRTPPSARAAPSALEAGAAHIESIGPYVALGIAAFRYEPTGNNALEQSSLVVADVQLGIGERDGLFLEALDMVRARKVTAVAVPLPGESHRSWEVAFGLQRASQDCIRCIEGFAEGSLGRYRRLGQRWLGGVSLGGRLSTRGGAAQVFPQATLGYRAGWRFQAEITAAYLYGLRDDPDDEVLRAGLRARYSLTADTELLLQLDRQDALQSRLLLSRRW